MICFKDTTFCGSDCVNQLCGRHFGDLEREQARAWWGSDDAPVAFSDFSGTCDRYAPGDGKDLHHGG